MGETLEVKHWNFHDCASKLRYWIAKSNHLIRMEAERNLEGVKERAGVAET